MSVGRQSLVCYLRPWPRTCRYWAVFSAATVNVLRTAQVLQRLHRCRPGSVQSRLVVWPGLFRCRRDGPGGLPLAGGLPGTSRTLSVTHVSLVGIGVTSPRR